MGTGRLPPSAGAPPAVVDREEYVFSSTKESQLPHSGHFPIHFCALWPHCWQEKNVLIWFLPKLVPGTLPLICADVYHEHFIQSIKSLISIVIDKIQAYDTIFSSSGGYDSP
jgi:hypothetical protein